MCIRDSNRGGKAYRASASLGYLDHTLCPLHDWRFPHLLAAYNDVARVLAEQIGLDFVDVYSVAFHVFDLFGVSHYPEAAPATQAAAMLLLHWLYGQGEATSR